MREVMVQVPNLGWADIGGADEAQDKLKEGIELPLKNPEAFRRLGIRPAKGFLLYGPPGHRQDPAGQGGRQGGEANFISIKSLRPAVQMVWRKRAADRRLFARARQVAPCVVFIDEIDSLVPARGSAGEPQVTARVVNTILAEMDGLEELQSVVVIGATNRPNLVDPALLRPGRFDELVYVGTPDKAGREHILKIHTAKMPLADDVDLAARARDRALHRGRSGRSGAPRRDCRDPPHGGEVTKRVREDFDKALARIRAPPSRPRWRTNTSRCAAS
jgi:transitional endoplasmic reticulum ATPase